MLDDGGAVDEGGTMEDGGAVGDGAAACSSSWSPVMLWCLLSGGSGVSFTTSSEWNESGAERP